MNLFEEQLNARRKNDEERLTDAMDSLAGAILGERVAAGLNEQETTCSAIEEILKYYRFKLPKKELPAYIKTTEEQISYRMQTYGINHRTVTLDNGWYRRAAGAMIGTLKEDGSAVALIPGLFSGYYLVDPQSGRRQRLTRRTAELLNLEAVCFYRPLPAKELGIKDLLIFMRKQLNMADITLHFGTLFLAALIGLLAPLFSKWLFGAVLASGSVKVLLALANFILCYTVSVFCIDIVKALTGSRINTKIDVAVEAAVMNRILNLPAEFFRDYSSGELFQRSQLVQSLCSTIVSTVMTTGISSLFSLIYILQIFTFASELVIPALVIICGTVAINLITIFIQIRVTREQLLRSSKTSGLTYSTITGIQKIKLAGAEKRMFSRWAKLYANEAGLIYNPPLFLKISGVISMGIFLFGTLIIYVIAVKSQIGVADYYAFNTAYGMVSGAFAMLTTVVSNIASIRPALDMVEPILKTKPEFSEGKKEIDKLNGGIELSNVSFAYDKNSGNIINNLSLNIRPGEYVAIVGPTGCGKSTLLRLLLGFEMPQRGDIYFDHVNLNGIDLKSLRRLTGTVMQDSTLFPGDIYSNITISAPQLSLDDAWKAAELAAIADDIRKMPMGMHTIISEGQCGISGGQKQRLMIARALAPNPKILIFDEATSALDNITQKKITEAIDTLRCTRIVSAHRLSTIRHADRILCLSGGRIAEEGTYQELIDKNGIFAELVKRQRTDIETD